MKPIQLKGSRDITKVCQVQECLIQAWTDQLLSLLHAFPPIHQTITCYNKKHLKNVGPIRYCEPPLHCQSPGVASRTPAIAIAQAVCDVHNDYDNDDNAGQRGLLWPHGMGPIR